MTKYLIIFLIFVILLLTIIVIVSKTKPGQIPPPAPVLTAPTKYPTLPPGAIQNTLSPADQIKIQSQADRDFVEKTKQINELYPWLDKLPLQTDRYFVYFDVTEKEFIAKLYPSASETQSLDEQTEGFKKEILTKLQELITDLARYNIRWEIKAE